MTNQHTSLSVGRSGEGEGAVSDETRAVVNGAASVSAVPASVPSAGDWVIWRGWGLNYRQIEKVTPKLLKLCRGGYPSQLARSSLEIVCIIRSPDDLAVRQLCDSIAGVDGEFKRRKFAASKEYNERVASAEEARAKATARLLGATNNTISGETER